MNTNEVVAQWGSRSYSATVNDYGVATIKAGSMPLEDHTPDDHELHRLDDDGAPHHDVLPHSQVTR